MKHEQHFHPPVTEAPQTEFAPPGHNDNPLKQYFRMPGITIKLPSMGNFQPQGNVSLTVTGELEIYPMKAADELLMKSPDALMAGSAVEKAILSCAPGIRDVRNLPSPDVDAILLAIRVATYGPNMEVHENCPACDKELAFNFDVETLLQNIEIMDSEYPVRLSDDVVVYLKPFSYRISTQANLLTFQEARKVQLIDNDSSTEEQKQKQLSDSYEKINQMNIEMISNSIVRIVIPNNVVTNSDHIYDYVSNVSAPVVKLLEDQLTKINRTGVNKENPVACQYCKHEWKTAIGFDPASFFGLSS